MSYLRTGPIADIKEGRAIVTVGIRSDGSVKFARYPNRQSAECLLPSGTSHPMTLQRYGTTLFNGPSRVRRVSVSEVALRGRGQLRFFVENKPKAVVLDFFAGSGTTTHAVARLNRQDGGRRQSIMVTNNEVSADEAMALRKRGFRPGDPEWEALGIFEHITRPRITAAITGQTPEGEPVEGDYKFTDEFPMAEGFEENVEFLELSYLDAEDVELDSPSTGSRRCCGCGLAAAVRSSMSVSTRRVVANPTRGLNTRCLFNADRWRELRRKRGRAARGVHRDRLSGDLRWHRRRAAWSARHGASVRELPDDVCHRPRASV